MIPASGADGADASSDIYEQTVIEQHYKTRELAERLGVHPETIRRAAQRGELESIRIGLDRIYAESAINR